LFENGRSGTLISSEKIRSKKFSMHKQASRRPSKCFERLVLPSLQSLIGGGKVGESLLSEVRCDI